MGAHFIEKMVYIYIFLGHILSNNLSTKALAVNVLAVL